jgi:hypothetical protein
MRHSFLASLATRTAWIVTVATGALASGCAVESVEPVDTPLETGEQAAMSTQCLGGRLKSAPQTIGSGTGLVLLTANDLTAASNDKRCSGQSFQLGANIDMQQERTFSGLKDVETFDGKGFEIKNLQARCTGLLTSVGSGGNVRLTSVKIAGGGCDREGGVGAFANKLARSNDRLKSGYHVEKVSVAGTVSSDGVFVGGVLGHQYGSVTGLHFVGTVESTGTRPAGVGGIVGLLGMNVFIDVSSSAGSVRARGKDSFAGGIVGAVDGVCTLNRVRSSATVSATWSGGIAGYLKDCGVNDSFATGSARSGIVNVARGKTTLRRVYSTAKASWGLSSSGYPGDPTAPGADTSFWDVTASGTTSSTSGLGLPTSKMKMKATYKGWDPNTWILVDGAYPKLR